MAIIEFDNVGIRGIAACVPAQRRRNQDLVGLFREEDLREMIETIGIEETRVAPNGVCASDLCADAAEALLGALDVDRRSIDMLIFMTQLGDYRIPATAPSLQHRLGLSKSTAAMDISLSCSGYVYALSTAFAYVSLPGVERVLLLDGETFSKLVNPRDKANAPLYGDAGTATLVEKGDFGRAWFSLGSDGSGVDVLKIDAGGGRNPTTAENVAEREAEEGNVRSPHQLFMDGMEVFNFTMMTVPRDIKKVIKASGVDPETIDLYVFHQANRLMTNFFAKRLKIPPDKVPYCIERFGNTSSASIPLTVTAELADRKRDRVVMAGFGAGLSWATALLSLAGARVLPLLERP